MPSIVTIGETMALLGTPDHCLLRPGSAPSLTIGGAESNVAIAAARLGARTTWIGRVGDDDLGSLVVRELRGQGVNVRAHRDPEAPTGLMVKEHRRGKPTHVRYYRKHSAGSRLEPDDLDQDVIADADIVHLTGITAALGDTARAALQHAITVARRGGATISFDVNYRATLWPPAAATPVLRELAGAADILFAGPEEAALLLPAASTPNATDDPMAGRRNSDSHNRSANWGHASPSSNSAPWAPWRCGRNRLHPPHRPHRPCRPGRRRRCVRRRVPGRTRQPESIETCLASGAKMGALVCAVPGDWEGTLDWSTDRTHDAEVRR